MHPATLIERKRDGEALSPAELRAFLDGYLRDEVAEYQMSAFLMAVYFRGLSGPELLEMTTAIIESGERLELESGPPAVDKHSTGGVGDKVSLVLAPLLAESGLRVPMMSGRGLGHTGGTLDKLESIPGFQTDLDLVEFQAVLADVGCAMIGQTPQIAPLDGRLYALRDVTGTVQSTPLISSSIVSKKVAEGIGGLVLDVKVGSGAFMADVAAARQLADTMVELAADLGLRATALLTAMDEPLGRAVGNALEVREAIDCLRGDGPDDLRAVTLALCAEAAELAGRPDQAGALARLLDSGAAFERFVRLVERQGGDARAIERPERLPRAPEIRDWAVSAPGRVARIDAKGIGLAAVELGAGRRAVGEAVDPAVGFEILASVGDVADAGQPLARIHARSVADAERAAERLEAAFVMSAASDPGSGASSDTPCPKDPSTGPGGPILGRLRSRSRP